MGEKRQDRRRFLYVAGGAVAGTWIPPARWQTPLEGKAGNIGRSSPVWQRAREVVRSGQLGRVAFCRSVIGDTSRDRLFALIDCVQFVFDEAAPVWVSAQGSGMGGRTNLMATFRYPQFVASFEQRAGAAEGTVICGTGATLVVGPNGCSLRGGTGGDVAQALPNTPASGVLPWRNFLESMRSRRRPVADIATRAPSRAAGRLVEMALRESRTIDCTGKVEAPWT